jgi:hypothetical protein
MCFSENESYLNTIMLILGGIYLIPNYRLTITLFFLAIKDLIQGLSYRFQGQHKLIYVLALLSWIHIAFQPLIVNLFFSHFDNDTNKKKYWPVIFIISIFFAILLIFTLKDFDIFGAKKCTKQNIYDDFCSDVTKSYIGKYHIGYQFRRIDDNLIFPKLYYGLMFIPALFTNVKYIDLLWLIFVASIYYNFKGIGSGEQAAIWCYSSILFALPTSLLHKYVSKFLTI